MGPSSSSSFWLSIIGGAIAGAVVTMLLWQSPRAQERLLTSGAVEEQADGAITVEPGPAARAYEQAIVSTVKEAQAAVVSIVISKDVPVLERYFEEIPGSFGPFGDLFGGFQVPRLRQNGTERQEIGGGSGFLVSTDGLVVTNRHVVNEEGAEYTVFLQDGTSFPAEVLATDAVNDIAVLKIQGNNLPFLQFSNSDELQVGQTAIAIGNALGEFENSVSTGVISGLSRSIVAGDSLGQAEQLEEVIQTDAAINPGNSGGPLLNLEGRVIGVNVAVALGSENIGFALPANLVKSIVESVQETGKIVRPYIGVRYIAVTPALQEANNLPVDYGALVVRGESAAELAVVPGSPANKAGIVEGDIILEVDGERLDDDTSLAQVIRKKQVGEATRLKILSKGQEREVTVTLEEASNS